MSPSLRLRTRAVRVLVTAGLLITLSVALPASTDAARRCSVRNVTTGHGYGSDLQGALDAAASSDTVNVSGRCIGNFVISTELTLVGTAHRGRPAGVIELNGFGPVLIVNATTATLRDIAITGGGQGIVNYHSNLTLAGASSVSGNTATAGAGIQSLQGSVTLTDSATVTDNHASAYGGGILSDGSGGGPGIGAQVFLYGTSTVSNNTAGSDGAGIWNLNGFVEMFDGVSLTSTITGNTAGGHGGGIFNTGGGFTLDAISCPATPCNVSGNSPENIYP